MPETVCVHVFKASSVVPLTKHAPKYRCGDILKCIVVLQMFAITILNVWEDAPRRHHVGQDADTVGDRKSHWYLHVGSSHPEVAQTLVMLGNLGPASQLAIHQTVANTWTNIISF